MAVDREQASLPAGPDAEARRRTVLAIERGETDRPAERLWEALGDPEWRVRKEAVRVACARAAALNLIPSLVQAICQEENVGLRNAALEVVTALGAAATPALLAALPRVPDAARRFIVEALAGGRDPGVMAALAEAVRGDDPIVAAAAVSALAAIGGTDAERVIREQLRADDPFYKLAAIDGLNQLGAAISWEELSPLLQDRLVRRTALAALGRCARPEAVAPLIEALSDRSTQVVSTAALALFQLHGGSAEAAQEVEARVTALEQAARARLRDLLVDGPMEVRQAVGVIACLARNREALPGVVALAALDALPLPAVDALRRWGGQAVRALLEQIERGGPGEILRATALELACVIASEPLADQDLALEEEIRRTLHNASNDPDPDLVLSASRCLAQWSEGADRRAAGETGDSRAGPARPLSIIPRGAPRLSIEDFRLLREIINQFCGILLRDESMFKVERRLGERVVKLGLPDFGAYCRYLRRDPERTAELERAVELLTINETYFFRELPQLLAFRDEVLPALRETAGAGRGLTVWSAGCSTGEEVYTLAILIRQSRLFEGREIRVFGNDISRRVLQVARNAVYGESSFRALPDEFRGYFARTPAGRAVEPDVRSLCQFGHFNLLDEPRSSVVGQVDAIFCRNVMIYFDPASRMNLIKTFYRRLRPGGFLMLGHSESLLNVSTAFELAQLEGDLAYRKPQDI